MKILLVTILFCLLGLSQQTQNLEQNIQNSIKFLELAFKGVPQLGVYRYVGDIYRQHNPNLPDGKQPFIDAFQHFHNQFPNKTIKFYRTAAQGDLVFLHSHQVWNKYLNVVGVDIFRFDQKGKIVEHWDSIQSIPTKELANKNTMYE